MNHIFSSCEWFIDYSYDTMYTSVKDLECIGCLIKYLELPGGDFRDLAEQKLIEFMKMEEYNNDFEEMLK